MAHKNKSNWSPYTARRAKSGAGPHAPSDKVKPGGSNSISEKLPVQKSGYSQDGSRHKKAAVQYSFAEADDRIYDVFRNHDFGDYPHSKRMQLSRFYELLMSNQNEQNFTRLLNIRDIAIKHFIDSIIVTRHVELKFPLLDMGTGPGFPGLPLKIHFPEAPIVLAEGVQRRVEFLKHVRSEMNLKALPIIGRNINQEVFYPVQGVITRAVEDASNTLGNVLNCIQTGGEVVLMKGPNCSPEIQPALDQWGEYFSLVKDVAYELPKTPHERRLLVFKKLKPAPLPDFEQLDLDWEKEFGAHTE
jgi:16S rRNA (guanine527-N7)-methyltransferase